MIFYAQFRPNHLSDTDKGSVDPQYVNLKLTRVIVFIWRSALWEYKMDAV